MRHLALLVRSRWMSVAAIAAVATVTVLLPAMAFAQDIGDPGSIPGAGGGQGLGLSDFETALDQIRTFTIFLAGIVVVVFLLWGGVSYLTAGANEEKREAAKQRMLYGIIGAAIIIGINVILATLGTIIGGGGNLQ